MAGGKYNERITIETPTHTQDEIGGTVSTWTTFAERWAKVVHEMGSEFFANAQDTPTRRLMFVIRNLTGLTEDMRVVYDGRAYQIHQIRPVKKSHEHEIRAVWTDDES